MNKPAKTTTNFGSENEMVALQNDLTYTTPSRFLQRIANYPESVQRALRAEMTDTILSTYLQVLHGAPLDGAAVPTSGGAPMLADSMLSRLITSKRFIARARHFLQLLHENGWTKEAEFIEYLNGMILPLADSDAPYIHKIDEVLAADPQGVLAEVLAPLRDILLLSQKLWDKSFNGAGPGKINGDWLAALILNAGQSGEVALLNEIVLALELPMKLKGAAQGNADLTPAGRLFLKKVLEETASLSALDYDSLRSIYQAQLETLTPPRSLTLFLTGAASAEAQSRWSQLKTAGLIAEILSEGSDHPNTSGGYLHLLANVEISPIALAWLSCSALPENSLTILASRRELIGTWAGQITGYLDDEVDLEKVGFYQCEANASTQPKLQMMLTYITAPANATYPAADCFAIVLRLDARLPLDVYDNIENCLIYDSLAELTQAMAGAPPRLQKKPVVVIGRSSPTYRNYIVASARQFRALGGAYLTTQLTLTYDAHNGRLVVDVPAKDHLTALAVAEVSALPLAALLDRPEVTAAQLQMGVVIMTHGFAVTCATEAVQNDPVLPMLQRRLDARQWTPAEQEQLFLSRMPNYSYLQTQDSALHWPIESMLDDIRQKHQKLRNQLNDFLQAPDVRLAAQILMSLSHQSEEVLTLASQIDTFALKLSENPAILLELPNDLLNTFFVLCRQTPSADHVAANLSVYAREICKKGIELIIPLFELLACCLAPNELRAALAFVADAQGNSRKYTFRVAECIRRYGDEPLMVQYLGLVKHNDPEVLNEVSFIRCFQKILDSPRLKTITAVMGGNIVRNIVATVPFSDNFQRAVSVGDKASMKRLVANPIPDFLKWIDGLRALSNELRLLASDDEAFPIPGITGLYRRKLAAVVFADKITLRGFAEKGFLDGPTDLDVIGQHLLGNSTPLNNFVARAFRESGFPPFEIVGSNTAEVFAHAQASLASLAPPRSSSALNAPLVSVIMSAFNPDIELMRQSIGSILAQTHSSIEIFVVDDASDQASSCDIRAMLADFSEIDYTRITVNSGPYVGRNLAISKAKGEFIAIQDADDWSHPQRFEAQLAAFRATPQLRLVTGQHVRIDRLGGIQMESQFSVFGDGPMTSMFRRQLFDEVGGFADIRSRGDVEMRERIRTYYGKHALQELEMPCMLCLADSATLSQKTKREAAEYLQIFRTNITRKRNFGEMRRTGEKLQREHCILVPAPLRAQVESFE